MATRFTPSLDNLLFNQLCSGKGEKQKKWSLKDARKCGHNMGQKSGECLKRDVQKLDTVVEDGKDREKRKKLDIIFRFGGWMIPSKLPTYLIFMALQKAGTQVSSSYPHTSSLLRRGERINLDF